MLKMAGGAMGLVGRADEVIELHAFMEVNVFVVDG